MFVKTTMERIDLMSHYMYFTITEREKILFFLTQSKSLSLIAKKLSRNKSSISRKVKRN